MVAMTQNPGQTAGTPQSTSGLDRFFAWLRALDIRRDTQDKWLAGVCSGLARRLGVDPLVLRAALIVLVLLGGVPPAWFSKDMGADGLPTWFGPCGFRYRPVGQGARLTLDGRARPPQGFVLRLPAAPRAQVLLDGREVKPVGLTDYALPAQVQEVLVHISP
jgi:phage shock protein PspC (stress-responsive transcriptional regulator)